MSAGEPFSLPVRIHTSGLWVGIDFFRAFELVCFRLSTSQLLLQDAGPGQP
jgi:hypothetical protein